MGQRHLRRDEPPIDQIDARVPVVGTGADRLQDESNARFLRFKAIGQLAGHRHGQVIAGGHFVDRRADLLGQPHRIAPHGEGIRLGVALSIGRFYIGAADIECQPLHGVNSTGCLSNRKSAGLPSAIASMAAARFALAANRRPTYEVVNRGLISITRSPLPSAALPSTKSTPT